MSVAEAPEGPAALPSASGVAPRLVTWGIAVLAVAYICYVGLLLCSDLLRVAPIGFEARFDDAGMTASSVIAGSAAERSGLRVGDRITRANGQAIASRLDWQRAC